MPVLPTLSQSVDEILNGKGYVVLPELISREEMEETRSLILKFAEAERPEGKTIFHDNRERVYGLVYKGKVFERMVEHPAVLEIIEAILQNVVLGGFSAHILYPGATPMGAHVDYPYFMMRSPLPANPILEVQAIWMVDDFTENNGALLIAPDTQKKCTKPDPESFAGLSQKVTGKAGTVILSHGLCWHNTSANTSNHPRVSLLGNYTPPYIRQIEDPQRDYQATVYEQFSPKLQDMMCLKVRL